MKKLFAFISVFLILSAANLFADVSVKKLSDGNVEVTFFYGNPRASEVVIAGDFTNWQNGALPMTKTDKGWTFTKTFPAGTTIKYKFISDGNWTTDLKAPDFVDDGFGGNNGLVDVDALAGGGAVASGPKIKFLTWSMLGYQMKWNKTADETDLDSAGINLTSYMKVTGDALPNVPIYFEIAVAEKKDFCNLYKKGELDWSDGFANFFTDLIFDPVAYFNGNEENKTYLGHFKFGLSSDYVNWTTGYKYAKLPPHQINDWITVDKEWEAGYLAVGGYNYFELGSALQQIGPLSIKAAVAPNRAADRAGTQYGMFAWVNASIGPEATFDFQYNGAYGKSFETIFDEIMETDLIVGYKGIFGPVTAKANYLVNFYGSYKKGDNKSLYNPATSDVGLVDDNPENKLDNMALNAQVNYANDTVNATAGFRFRGKQASMMYVEEGADDHTDLSDQLGILNHMRAWIDVNANVTEGVNIGLKPYFQTSLNKDVKTVYKNKDTVELYAKPYFALDLDELAYIPGKLDGYVELGYITEKEDNFVHGTNNSPFAVVTGGLKYEQTFDNDIFKGATFTYGFDNTNTSYLFNTLLMNFDIVNDYKVQAGVGLRTAWEGVADPVNPFGFFVGASKKLTALAKPTGYVQFMYAMDPYNEFNDGPTAYRMDADSPYITKDGVEDYKENFALRIGLQWDL